MKNKKNHKKKVVYVRTRSLFSRIFRFSSWLDAHRLREFLVSFIGWVKGFFFIKPRPKIADHSFELLLQQYNLTEATVAKQARALLWWSRLMCVIAIGMVGLAVYDGFYGTWKALILCVILVGVSATLAFRYHFLFFHLQSRKIGCSLSEWFYQGLLGRRS